MSHTIHRAAIPKPPMGGKSYHIEQPGLHILEEGPGNVWHLICQRTGTKGVELWDGYFHGGETDDAHVKLVYPLFKLDPAILGVWHLNAGFRYGLIARVHEGEGLPSSMTAIWMRKNGDPADGTAVRGEQHTKQISVRGSEKAVLSEKAAIFYQCQVTQAGSGSIVFFDGDGRKVFTAPPGVAGSFLLEFVYCPRGLRYEIDTAGTVTLTLTWFDVKETDSVRTNHNDTDNDDSGQQRS